MTAKQVAQQKKPRVTSKWIRKIAFDCKIRGVRLSLGLTMRDCCKETGIDIASLVRIEKGGELWLSKALALSKFFGRPITELWIPRKNK